MPEWGTLNLIEAVWCAVAGRVLWCSASLVRSRRARERERAQRAENGGLLIVSQVSVQTAGFATAIGLIGVLIGLLAALTPEPEVPRVNTWSLVVSFGLIAQLVLVERWTAISQQRDRRLVAYYRALEARLGAAGLRVVEDGGADA